MALIQIMTILRFGRGDMLACKCFVSKTYCTVSDFAERFIQRWDIHAHQLVDGRYICIHEPLHVDHIFAHLFGEITLGIYLLNQNSEARFVVIDVDDEQGFNRLLFLAKALAGENVPSYLEESRRGGHLWMFLREAVPGREARAFARGLLATHQVDNVEIFPKRDKLTGGPGSLIRMPFGMHRLTGHRYKFFTSDESPLASTIHEQIQALSAPQTVPEAVFEAYQSYEPSQPKKLTHKPLKNSREVISERIKDSITVLDFISQYVDLKPSGSGAIGLCPFHDDHRPSFGVNVRGNYWHCFAGCGGGSVIDFWMKYRMRDFTTAVVELAQML